MRLLIIGSSIVGALVLLPACERDRGAAGEGSAAADTSTPALISAGTARARAQISGPPGSGIK
ncbi:MAG TPA: hypothetical protein VFS51_11610, partial [Gemmatimonadales bacterium]|nr:hypothetical protein [Gemmatimonadales bacterium]